MVNYNYKYNNYNLLYTLKERDMLYNGPYSLYPEAHHHQPVQEHCTSECQKNLLHPGQEANQLTEQQVHRHWLSEGKCARLPRVCGTPWSHMGAYQSSKNKRSVDVVEVFVCVLVV